ncbi:MAG: hypothetical protein IKY43_03995 [Bacteroidales bacterium]|nr:hypothetical protein [Bacteroidales bacterium]
MNIADKVLKSIIPMLFCIMLVACDKENPTDQKEYSDEMEYEYVAPIALNADTKAMLDEWCMYGFDYRTFDSILLKDGVLVIKSQEDLYKLSPEIANIINLNGKMMVFATYGVRYGIAEKEMKLYRNYMDNTCVCRIFLSRGKNLGMECDAPIITLCNIYPRIDAPIELQVIEN